ncbi:MAG: Lrp/AsnC family transcriptional regulator [Paracoccaceae bacterium]
MQIDEKDRQLLLLLSENARSSVSDLARALGLARTTVQARIERLENTGYIAGYTLRKGPSARPVLRASALLSVEPRAGAAVLQKLKTLPQVEKVHTTSGRFDLVVELSAQSTEELDKTLDDIGAARGVKSSESLIHLSTKIDRSA